MTKVSVVLINNAEKDTYLQECLESVCQQSLKDIEIIIVNDGFSVSNLDLCRKYAKVDSRIKNVDLKCIKQDKIHDSIIEGAEGKYITFVDLNDSIHLDMCKNMYDLAQKHNADMVKSAWYDFDELSYEKNTSLAEYDDYDKYDPKYTLFQSFAQNNEDIWGTFYRTQYLKKNNITYFNSDKYFRAISFCFKAYTLTDSAVITPNAYYYRRDNHKDLKSYSFKKTSSIFSVYKEIDDLLDKKPKVKKIVSDRKLVSQLQIYKYIFAKVSKNFRKKFAELIISDFKKYFQNGDISNEKMESPEMETVKSLIFHDYIISAVRNIEIEKKCILPSNDRIPVILSSDDNYSCFIATTGVSVLYHTNSFIEFYILSEGISEENKKLIENSFRQITNNFSIKFIECDSKKYFSDVKLPKEDYVKINTCNRLLFPYYEPKIDRAIYLDVDLIVMDDIRKLWDINLNGHVFGACPLYVERLATIIGYKNKICIPEEHTFYHYLNSGILLIDYKKWRELKNDNKGIVNDIFELLETIYTDCTPDELLLNKFAYLNGGYYELPPKYNVQSYYSFNYLKRNKNKLDSRERWTLNQFRLHAKRYDYKEELKNFDGVPAIRHFYGADKPWNSISQWVFPIPLMPQFFDFWFYASKTLFFEEIQDMFIENILKN